MREELDSEQTRSGSGEPLEEDMFYYNPNELAVGAMRETEEGSGGHGAYGARKEGVRRQVGNRGESKDCCGSPPRPHSTTICRV